MLDSRYSPGADWEHRDGKTHRILTIEEDYVTTISPPEWLEAGNVEIEVLSWAGNPIQFEAEFTPTRTGE